MEGWVNILFDCSCLDPFQSGFKPGYGTEKAQSLGWEVDRGRAIPEFLRAHVKSIIKQKVCDIE